MILLLARSIRENWLATLLSPLCMIGEVYMELKIPSIIGMIVDNGIEPGNISVVWPQGLLLILCALCSLCFGVGSALFAAISTIFWV